MQERVAAEHLDQQHSHKTHHGEAAIHPLRIATPAEGRHIVGGGGRLRNGRGVRGLAGGGHPAGSGTPEVIAGRRDQPPVTVSAQLKNRVMK